MRYYLKMLQYKIFRNASCDTHWEFWKVRIFTIIFKISQYLRFLWRFLLSASNLQLWGGKSVKNLKIKLKICSFDGFGKLWDNLKISSNLLYGKVFFRKRLESEEDLSSHVTLTLPPPLPPKSYDTSISIKLWFEKKEIWIQCISSWCEPHTRSNTQVSDPRDTIATKQIEHKVFKLTHFCSKLSWAQAHDEATTKRPSSSWLIYKKRAHCFKVGNNRFLILNYI